MGVQPDPAELIGPPSLIDLLLKEIRHRLIFESHRHNRRHLRDQDQVFDQQQIVGRRDPEPANLGRTAVTQEDPLRPGRRTEAERRSLWWYGPIRAFSEPSPGKIHRAVPW